MKIFLARSCYITVTDLACALATMIATAVLLLTLFLLLAKSDPPRERRYRPIVVRGLFGRVRGIVVTNPKVVFSFLGIPFAEPPLGRLRFKNPIMRRPSEDEEVKLS